jgi:hypothetical protein
MVWVRRLESRCATRVHGREGARFHQVLYPTKALPNDRQRYFSFKAKIEKSWLSFGVRFSGVEIRERKMFLCSMTCYEDEATRKLLRLLSHAGLGFDYLLTGFVEMKDECTSLEQDHLHTQLLPNST